MKVLIIGAGNMGSAFARQLVNAGHQVRITARGSDKAQAAAAAAGASAVALDRAADGMDAVVLATGFDSAVAALRSVGDLTGKTIVDITNPLTADFMGLTIGHNTSAAEQIAAAVPGARVVKAFNTVFAQVLAAGPDFGNGHRVPVFVAADNADAKADALALAKSMGFETIDAGPLANARYLEPLAGLNIYLGYGAGLGTDIAPTWLKKA